MWRGAGVVLGVAAHWRLYPALFGLAAAGHSTGGRWLRLVNRRSVRMGLATIASFFALLALCYHWQGGLFIQEAYLYHRTRRDHRHNFSPMFLPIYHALTAEAAGRTAAFPGNRGHHIYFIMYIFGPRWTPHKSKKSTHPRAIPFPIPFRTPRTQLTRSNCVRVSVYALTGYVCVCVDASQGSSGGRASFS